jgi:hypothetical protein
MAGMKKLNGDVALLELLFEENEGTAKDAKSAKFGEVQAPAKERAVTLSESDALSDRGRLGQPKGLRVEPRRDVDDRRLFAGAQSDTHSSTEPLAEVVWLVLNEGQAQQQPPVEDGAAGDKQGLPAKFYLSPPRPNPFGQGTCINYGLPRASGVNLSVFDAAGRRVRMLVAGTQPAGRYSVVWNGRDAKGRQLASGVYFMRLVTDNLRFQRKATLVRQ